MKTNMKIYCLQQWIFQMKLKLWLTVQLQCVLKVWLKMRKAYEMGIKNTIIALDMLLGIMNEPWVNINCMDRIKNRCDKLIEILDEKI